MSVNGSVIDNQEGIEDAIEGLTTDPQDRLSLERRGTLVGTQASRTRRPRRLNRLPASGASIETRGLWGNSGNPQVDANGYSKWTLAHPDTVGRPHSKATGSPEY